jgi:CBS domain-containing protein
MSISVEDIMTSVVVCAKADYSVQELMQIMDNKALHCVPIIDQIGHCIGVVSGTDLLRWQKLKERSSDVYAHEILSHPVISVTPQVSLRDASKLMADNDVHHLVVVDRNELIEIVCVVDVLAQLLSGDNENYVDLGLTDRGS